MNEPNPGSPEAKEMGCLCPVIDNGRGRGSGQMNHKGEPMFWIAKGCPVHPMEPEPTNKSLEPSVNQFLDLIYEPWRRLCIWAFNHIRLGPLAPHVLQMGCGRKTRMKRIQ